VSLSRSTNHFIDTNVILRHANDASLECNADIQKILDEAVCGKRNLWVSSALFAELRPTSFMPGAFSSVDDLAKYIRSIATVITPDPITMLRVARLRDVRWMRPKPMKNEKPKSMSLGDAMHIASALWVKEVEKVEDIEFLTFDDGGSKTSELDPGTNSLSLLRLENYTDGVSANPDVIATVRLHRCRPKLPQGELHFPAATPTAGALVDS
jgi:hypothetical protein